MANRHTNRHNTWTFVCYPESLPEGWERQLGDLHVPCAYILHDKDAEEDGTLKKPHYHVIAKYDGVKTLEQVQQDFSFTGISYIEPVKTFRAMCRYLCHLDEEGKHQYPVDDVRCVSGMSPDFSRKLTKTDELKALQDMTQLVEDNDINEFAALWNYAVKHEPDWLAILSSRASYGVSQYIRSRRCAEVERQRREREHDAALAL